MGVGKGGKDYYFGIWPVIYYSFISPGVIGGYWLEEELSFNPFTKLKLHSRYQWPLFSLYTQTFQKSLVIPRNISNLWTNFPSPGSGNGRDSESVTQCQTRGTALIL